MAEYVLRRFGREDKATIRVIKAWWEEQTDAKLGDHTISDFGYMIMDDFGTHLASTFLYPIMGSQVALIGFPVANPDISKETRRKALSLLTTCIETDARKLNYKFLISYAGSEGAKEMFSRLGYNIFDTNVTNFGKVI